MERGERAVHDEHGTAEVAKTPSVPQAHSDMGVGDKIRHHQQGSFTSFHASSPMEVDDPSFSMSPTQAVGDMSMGPGPSTPVFSVSSVRGPRMSTGTNAAPAFSNNFSFSASNRGAD